MRSGSSATGNSFSNLVGTGSNRHVVGLDAVISLFSSSCPIVVKHSSFSLGAMNEAEFLDAVESTLVIIFLMLSILLVKKTQIVCIRLFNNTNDLLYIKHTCSFHI